MPVSELTPFSYVILLLVGSHGAAPHDLVRMQRQGNWIYWTAAESRFYSEPKRLSELGYLETRASPAGPPTAPSTRSRPGPGRDRAMAGRARGFVRIQNEPAARLTGPIWRRTSARSSAACSPSSR